MFADEVRNKVCHQCCEHNVKNNIVGVGHFQHQYGAGKRAAGNAGKKTRHAA